eukprot:m.47670 g.47670  ORF g.47670 m.47670 type:complete len:558 (+) comp6917_c0_seq1:36-1709(+)
MGRADAALVLLWVATSTAIKDDCQLPTCVTLPGNTGNVEGLLSENHAFVEFKGIPFAEPPIGLNRWEPPRPSAPWGAGNTREAKEFKPNCIQSNVGGVAWPTMVDSFSEDCLYLNVWMPWSEQEKLEPMPVCLYIHGGGYAYGGANDVELDGSFFAEIGNCVMVTIQYRLGVFGFLGHPDFRTGVDNSTGNWGIQDQRLAIKWVHDNIASFNGNPWRILLFGESAGAASVSNHVAMNKSWPYFAHAAMQSGGFQDWAAKTLDDAAQNFEMFVDKMNCTSGSAAQVKQCLQNASVASVVLQSTSYVYPSEDSWTNCRWAPVIDNVELSDHPNVLLQRGDVHPTAHLILGTNEDEGTSFIGYNKTGTLPVSLPYNLTKDGFVTWSTAQWGAAASSMLLQLFPVPSTEYPSYWKAAQRVVGLYMMTCPNRRFARLHAATREDNSTYVYFFAELPGKMPTRDGVFHGADIRFVFFNVVFLTGWDEKDLGLMMNRFWTDLAATGDPNVRAHELRVRPVWPPVMKGSMNVSAIHLEASGVKPLPDVKHTQCNYFDTLPPNVQL